MSIQKRFISNGLIMTATSLLLRCVGVVFNTFISNKLGSEGMGVYSLVQSVFGFAVTFACSGINLGTVRLVSDALAVNNYISVKVAIKKCVLYSIFFSSVATSVLFFGARFIGLRLLCDVRTVKSIRFLAFSLPFISLSSVFNGYYSAVRRVYKNASVIILEQFLLIGITTKIISLYAFKGVEYACISVAVGSLLAEICSLLFNYILFLIDVKKHISNNGTLQQKLGRKLVGISLPLALSSYARSGLVTVEHLLIPYGLRKSGVTFSQSMAKYGLIQGMVFPIIMFPSCIIYSFAGLLVPELARMNERKQLDKINRVAETVLNYSLIYAIGTAGLLICFAYELSVVIYNSAESFSYIYLFAPLVTVMYLDAAVDGILKGLNEQIYSMKINIIDASFSVLLVYFLVPHFGIKGYIVAIFVCEILNCSLSLTRLVKICDINFSLFKSVFLPLFYIVLSTATVTLFFEFFNITKITVASNLVLRILLILTLYLLLNYITHKKPKVHQLA